MRTLVSLAFVCAHGAWAMGATGNGETPRSDHQAAPPPHCEIAAVNPISGYAECVKPRGVAVPPPPQRPGAPAAPPDRPRGLAANPQSAK